MLSSLTLVLIAAISTFFYVWFGIGFALLAPSLLGLLGAPITRLVGLVLLAQSVAAVHGSLLRHNGNRKGSREALLFAGTCCWNSRHRIS